MHYVTLNPDGSQPVNLAVIVLAKTGVTYQAQCGGLATEERSAEGFLVPVERRCLDGSDLQVELESFFKTKFGGHSYDRQFWSADVVRRLSELVSQVVMWHSTPETDSRSNIELDAAQIEQATEAWLPVKTPYGPGILVFENGD